MIYQIKAEFYKLFHSRQFTITIGIMAVLMVLLIAMANGDGGFYMGIIPEYVGIEPVQIGFILSLKDAANPTMWEVIYSATVLNVLLWIVLVTLTVNLCLNEFKSGTMKLLVSYGKSRSRIYFAKLFTINAFFGILYFIFNFIGLFACANIFDYPISGELIKNTAALVGLNYLIFVVISAFTLWICLLIKSNIVATALMIIYIMSMVFIFMSTYEGEPNILLTIYDHINPMYYLMYANTFWAYDEVAVKIILYFIFGLLGFSGLACYTLKKQEIK